TTWLPFLLHPEYPPEGRPREQRPGSERIPALFAEHGLVYNPPPTVIPNSTDALRVTELARDRGVHEPLHDRLMDAYWRDGEHVGEHEVLRRHALEVGLESVDVDEVLTGDAYLARVQASTQQAVEAGAGGVPSFLLDRRLLVVGAHPKATFERVFERLAAADV